MRKTSREAGSVSADSRERRSHDQSATKRVIVKLVFILTLSAALFGWLWLIAKGAAAIARLL
jgi:hypothetical protein